MRDLRENFVSEQWVYSRVVDPGEDSRGNPGGIRGSGSVSWPTIEESAKVCFGQVIGELGVVVGATGDLVNG